MELQKFEVLNNKVHTMAHLPDEILKKIFKKFKIKQLLEFGLVCQSWNNFLTSPDYMDRVRVGGNIIVDQHWKIFLDVISKSKRNYMHLEIDSSEYILGKVLSLDKFNWKSIIMYNFQIERDFIRNLRELAPSLETVRMAYHEDMTSHQLFSLMYPKIKLECRYGFKSVVTLLRDVYANDMTGVKELSIEAGCLEKILQTWHFKCPLRKFQLYKRKNRPGKGFVQMIMQFLTYNEDTLEEIDIEALDNNLLEFLVNKMKNLKILTIGKDAKIRTKILALNVNTNITTLESKQAFSDLFYTTIFHSVPKLNRLLVPVMTHSLMEITVVKLPELTFMYSKIIVADVPNDKLKFKKLKEINFEHFIHPFDGKTRFFVENLPEKEQWRWLFKRISLVSDNYYD